MTKGAPAHIIACENRSFNRAKAQYEFNCGHCPPCTYEKVKERSFRMMTELPYWGYNAVKLDLTYSPEALDKLNEKRAWEHMQDPEKYPVRYNSVDMRDGTNYIKAVKKHFKDRKFTHVTATEYGSENGRPHLHVVLFGATMADQIDLFNLWGKSIWAAFVITPFIDTKQAQYVCKYVLKGGQKDEWKQLHPDKERPQIKYGRGYSQDLLDGTRVKRGMGYQYAMDNKDKLLRDKCIYFDQRKQTVPRYIADLIGLKFDPKETEEDFLKNEAKWLNELEKYKKTTGFDMEPDQIISFWEKQKEVKRRIVRTRTAMKDPKAENEYRNIDLAKAEKAHENEIDSHKMGIDNAMWAKYHEKHGSPYLGSRPPPGT